MIKSTFFLAGRKHTCKTVVGQVGVEESVVRLNFTECGLKALEKCTFAKKDDTTSSTTSTTTTTVTTRRPKKTTTAMDSFTDDYEDPDEAPPESVPGQAGSTDVGSASIGSSFSRGDPAERAVGRLRESQAGQIIMEMKAAKLCDTSSLESQLVRITDYQETVLGEFEEMREAVDALKLAVNQPTTTTTTTTPRPQIHETDGSGSGNAGEEDGLVEEEEEARTRMTREAVAEEAANITIQAMRKGFLRLAVFLNRTMRKNREEMMQVPVLWIRPMTDSILERLGSTESRMMARLQTSMESIQREARDADQHPHVCLWEGGQMIVSPEQWFNATVAAASLAFAKEMDDLVARLRAETIAAERDESTQPVQCG